MSITTLYPVYVREIPSRVRAIAGLATSITISREDRACSEKKATIINSHADFERSFGGRGGRAL